MELSIKPSSGNAYPLHGILVKSASAVPWLRGIRQMGLLLNDIRIYPIPGLEANSIWGCLLLCHHKVDSRLAGRYELCQMLTPHLLIPERSSLYPAIHIREVEKLFPSQLHLFHPEFGLVELTEELNLKALLAEPELRSYHITRPEKPLFVPMQVKSFQVKPLPQEEMLKQMDEKLFAPTEDLPKDELNKVEQARLKFYELLYGKKDKDGKPVSEGDNNILTRYGEKLGALLDSLIPKNSGLSERMHKDFEELQRRNQAEIEKLMELFKNNPEEALKYAIPLDDNGSTRGGENMEFNLSKRWSDFSMGNMRAGSGSGSGSVDLGDEYRRQLRKQYNDTAEELIRKKEYEKAAFVYMKLLKDIHRAAGTLEDGKLYQEAAMIYLKHANNKQKAAECYEKGKMINDAIDLYKELKQDEKVGDLYMSIKRHKEAHIHYEMVVNDYRSKDEYVKASMIYRNKMLNLPAGQELLMEGWRKHKQAINCLFTYINNIEDHKIYRQEIQRIYDKELTEVNKPDFLYVMKHEYNKENDMAETIRDMAYEIIASQLSHNASVANDLKVFNKHDKEITKDVQRFMDKKNK